MHCITWRIVRPFSSHFITGLRKRANKSPTLSTIYLNDLEQFFQDRNVSGLETRRNDIQYIVVYILYVKLLVLFYADNTILLANNNEKHQKALGTF